MVAHRRYGNRAAVTYAKTAVGFLVFKNSAIKELDSTNFQTGG
jgi:hypothetical protein